MFLMFQLFPMFFPTLPKVFSHGSAILVADFPLFLRQKERLVDLVGMERICEVLVAPAARGLDDYFSLLFTEKNGQLSALMLPSGNVENL